MNVVVDLEGLRCHTGYATTPDGGQDVSLDELLRLACNGMIVPWVFDS